MLIAPIVLAMELLFIITIPMQSWSHTVEFLNDLESSSVFRFQFPLIFVGFTITYLVIGYFDNRQRMYETVNAVGNQWLWALLVLHVTVGITGVLTGLLL
jgi:hypothetical protein